MSEKKYILVLDQGTTSSRAILIDKKGSVCAIAQKEFEQIYPHPGWVEHNPEDLWLSQYHVAKDVVEQVGCPSIVGLGITNQRETTIVWDRQNGKPLCNAIVWQDRRTSQYCDELKTRALSDMIQQKTGLLPDAYFSATKIKWILDHIKGAREKANKGQLAFGTVDTWLIWRLTDGRNHVTDATNASRTMLYNLKKRKWDDDLLELFTIPGSMLADVRGCSDIYGTTDSSLFGAAIPIAGVAGDQHAALFGQQCVEKGMIKNTYGTGCFILMNTGENPIISKNHLLSTLAWVLDDEPTYALEGSIFTAGAVVQWLRDGIKIIPHSNAVETLAAKATDNGGVYFVPAFTGLGAPHWDQYARGTLIGLTRGTTDAHIARAALEAIAYQTMDVLNAMVADANMCAKEMRVDGGASANNLLMQFQSDVLNIRVIRPKIIETTAMGAGFFAGLAVGFWQNIDEIQTIWQQEKEFTPSHNRGLIEENILQWQEAVTRSSNWSKKVGN